MWGSFNDELPYAAEWLPLGVFAVTQDGEQSGPPPTLFVQLTINKQGIIAGTFNNTATDFKRSRRIHAFT